MIRCAIGILGVWLLAGCGQSASRMAQPENPEGRYREQIAVARRALEQNESWADRADWEVKKHGDGWEVVAWRIERPERQGPERYVPWGYAVVELDSRLVAVHYRAKK